MKNSFNIRSRKWKASLKHVVVQILETAYVLLHYGRQILSSRSLSFFLKEILTFAPLKEPFLHCKYVFSPRQHLRTSPSFFTEKFSYFKFSKSYLERTSSETVLKNLLITERETCFNSFFPSKHFSWRILPAISEFSSYQLQIAN